MYSSAYVWAKILSYLEDRLSAVTVSGWFDDAEVVELTEEQLVIYSPSDFRRDWIRRRCAEYIQDGLKEIFNSGNFSPVISSNVASSPHSLCSLFLEPTCAGC